MFSTVTVSCRTFSTAKPSRLAIPGALVAVAYPIRYGSRIEAMSNLQ
jgi:hypothetical protein